MTPEQEIRAKALEIAVSILALTPDAVRFDSSGKERKSDLFYNRIAENLVKFPVRLRDCAETVEAYLREK